MKIIFSLVSVLLFLGSTHALDTLSGAKKITTLSELQATCIQAYDGCDNMCTREAGKTDRACTKKGCVGEPKDAQCIMSTNDMDLRPTVCTMEYNPVCGSKQVQCIKAPCPAIQQTYGNICTMNADGASLVSTGECPNTTMVGNDEDSHGCIGSAGYSRSQAKQECVRIWEYEATDLEKAYDLAYNNGITTMDSLKKFRANDSITRQEAAKMLVAMAENLYGKKYASYPDECNIAYKDESLFDSTLKNHIYSACAHNIMKGSQGRFMAQDNLTKGQTIAIIMRTIVGRENEKTTPWWEAYHRSYFTYGVNTPPSGSFYGMQFEKDKILREKPITRGELVQEIYMIYGKSINQ